MVKYDPVLGAFRTIDGGSQNGNTDTIFAGSGLLTRINETGFQTTWSPDFSVNTNLSDVLFSVMYRFDGDEFANAVAHLDFVRRLDALENGNSGGAADITVNGVSPDADGNIVLKAEDISFNFKNSLGEDIPRSASIGNTNLQTFFEGLQYAIFSVNGYSAYFDSDNDRVIGDITITGDAIFLEPDGRETPTQDWDGNPLASKTLLDAASDLYTYGIREIMINGDGSSTFWSNSGTADLDLTADKIDVYRNYDSEGSVSNRYTVMNSLEDMNSFKMEIPEYGDITSTDEMGESYESTMVTHYAPCNGWLIIDWCSEALKDDSYVEIGGVQFHLGTVSEAGGLAWRQFIFPIATSTEWLIYDDEVRSYRVRFLPCGNIVNLYGE